MSGFVIILYDVSDVGITDLTLACRAGGLGVTCANGLAICKDFLRRILVEAPDTGLGISYIRHLPLSYVAYSGYLVFWVKEIG
jgi:hypothetical protein